MSDTFYEECLSKKQWTYDPLHSASCSQCWQRHMTATNRNKEELGKEINYVFKFRRGKRVLATHSNANVVKIEKAKNICCTAEHYITSWAGSGCTQFTTRIQPFYIRHSEKNSFTPHHNYSRIQAKQEWPKQVTLCQQETDSNDSTIIISTIPNTVWTQTMDKLGYLVAMANINCKC